MLSILLIDINVLCNCAMAKALLPSPSPASAFSLVLINEGFSKIKVFIVTSFPDYLDEAMRFQVFRYLSKPIDKSRLFRNLKDAVYLHNMEAHVIPVTSKDGVVALPADQFVCVETDSRKTYIYTPTDKIQSVESIEKWKEKLTLPCFYMPYRSFIVNMQYVRNWTKTQFILKDGQCISIGRSYQNTAADEFTKYIGKVLV